MQVDLIWLFIAALGGYVVGIVFTVVYMATHPAYLLTLLGRMMVTKHHSAMSDAQRSREAQIAALKHMDATVPGIRDALKEQ